METSFQTQIQALEEVYTSLQKSTDPEVCVARRNLYLIIEDLKGSNESAVNISYFYNEKGDYTITLHEEPVAVSFSESSALKLVNHVKGLSLRVDTLSKIKTFSLT